MTNTKDALQAQKNALMEALKTLRAIQKAAEKAAGLSDQQNAEMDEVEMDVLSAATRLTQLISKMD